MTETAPQLYTIPAGQSFVDILADGLMARAGEDLLTLSGYTVLLPTRRACRALREAFLRRSQGRPLLLPRMQPLGDADADELGMLLAANDAETGLTDIPPAIDPLRRQILLARTIAKVSDLAPGFDRAAALALELGRLLDEVQTEGLAFDGLQRLVPESLAEHWQVTLDFLKILTEHWPQILEEEGVVDHAERRNRLLQAQCRVWSDAPPQHPVIAAGSTGSIPAVAELLALVAKLPQGEVILPGLDRDMDEASWEAVEPDHPQFYLKQLLGRLDASRENVADWPHAHAVANPKRSQLVSEMMRPAATSEGWQHLPESGIDETAVAGLTRIDCSTPQEEAEVIALILRGALEDPDRTAALVTPDRRLARRVAAALSRWGILVDDSGGRDLPRTPAGAWLLLVARMVLEEFAPVPLLACLKHPFAACGMNAYEFARAVRKLEIAVLHGPRPAPGIDGLRRAVDTADERRIAPDDKPELFALLDAIETAVAPFAALVAQEEVACEDWLTAHIRMAETMAATDEEAGAARVWRHEDGEVAANFFAEFRQLSGIVPVLNGLRYAGLIETLMEGQVVRPRFGSHPRLHILGQIEARLYTADLMVLAGMNEGTWPSGGAVDPWMSRPMRLEFGLPAPECRVGQEAHDFAMAAGARETILTRSQRVDGAPTVPARWLLRLETVLKGAGLELPRKSPAEWRAWAEALDLPAPETMKSCDRPAPRPPVSARPRKLSVTQVETWMRDPYEIYAKHILNLRMLDPIDADPGAAERGIAIHRALERFVRAYRDELPDDAYEKLLECGREAFAELGVPPEVHAFWWPRFEQAAGYFLDEEREWRAQAKNIATECSGHIDMDGAAGPFRLIAKADRIDKLADGGLAIIDYKTGQPPKDDDVELGFSPQLPLEAVIASAGGFRDIAAAPVKHLAYWRMSGGQVPDKPKRRDSPVVEQLAEQAHEGLQNLIIRYDDANSAYPSMPRADRKPRYSDYEHLARVREWSSIGGEDGE